MVFSQYSHGTWVQLQLTSQHTNTYTVTQHTTRDSGVQKDEVPRYHVMDLMVN